MKNVILALLLSTIGCVADTSPEHVTYTDEALTTRGTWPGIGDTGTGPMVMDGLADWAYSLSSNGVSCSWSPGGSNQGQPSAYTAICYFTICFYTCSQWNVFTEGYASNGQWRSTTLNLIGTYQGSFQFALPQSMGTSSGYDSGYVKWREYSYSFRTYSAYGQIEQRSSDGFRLGVFQR